MANPQLSLSPSQPLKKVSIPWVITISYLVVLLVLPAAALFAKSLTLGFAEFWRVATLPISLSAYQVTFFTSLIAGLIDGVFGTIIAWVLVRYRFPGKKIVDACVDLPFALPTSVAGLVLATVYSDNGWLGQFFAPFGIKISFTILGVFVAMLFIALPFIVLGASSWQIFWRVIFPTILPAILTGVALGFARAIGEYGSVVIISSNIPFKDLIAPVLIFQRLEEYDYTGATVIGMVLLLVSLFMLVVINFLQQWGQKYRVK